MSIRAVPEKRRGIQQLVLSSRCLHQCMQRNMTMACGTSQDMRNIKRRNYKFTWKLFVQAREAYFTKCCPEAPVFRFGEFLGSKDRDAHVLGHCAVEAIVNYAGERHLSHNLPYSGCPTVYSSQGAFVCAYSFRGSLAVLSTRSIAPFGPAVPPEGLNSSPHAVAHSLPLHYLPRSLWARLAASSSTVLCIHLALCLSIISPRPEGRAFPGPLLYPSPSSSLLCSRPCMQAVVPLADPCHPRGLPFPLASSSSSPCLIPLALPVLSRTRHDPPCPRPALLAVSPLSAGPSPLLALACGVPYFLPPSHPRSLLTILAILLPLPRPPFPHHCFDTGSPTCPRPLIHSSLEYCSHILLALLHVQARSVLVEVVEDYISPPGSSPGPVQLREAGFTPAVPINYHLRLGSSRTTLCDTALLVRCGHSCAIYVFPSPSLQVVRAAGCDSGGDHGLLCE
jgi:hypothetical protein